MSGPLELFHDMACDIGPLIQYWISFRLVPEEEEETDARFEAHRYYRVANTAFLYRNGTCEKKAQFHPMFNQNQHLGLGVNEDVKAAIKHINAFPKQRLLPR